MDNRERDKVSRNNSSSTEAGDVNRQTSERQGRQKSDSDANFGQNIGRSENLENEPSRRGSSDSSYGSSSSRSSGSDSEH
jgi:hypothetical protein